MGQSNMRGLVRTGALSAALFIAACTSGPQVLNDKTFHFDVAFDRDAQGRATSVRVTPNPPQQGIYVGGNAAIRVPATGHGHYRIEWESTEKFSMMFETIIADSAPEGDRKKKIGNESETWTAPKKKDGVNLTNGTGRGREVVISKYSLRDDASQVSFDPVIIIDR